MSPLFESREPARDQVVEVVRSLLSLLSKYKEQSKVDWLAERLKILEDGESDSSSVVRTLRELHGIALGIDGLMDLHLEGAPQEANDELERLADQLYELTRT